LPSHERLAGRHGTSAQLDLYLDLLKRKPGALARSLRCAASDRGDWPACFDELWSAIHERVGREEAARQIVDVLLLHREVSASKVELAVRGALAAGAHDGRAVALLARRCERTAAPALEVEQPGERGWDRVAVLADCDHRLAVHAWHGLLSGAAHLTRRPTQQQPLAIEHHPNPLAAANDRALKVRPARHRQQLV
jgi:hypothetical protein